MGNLLFSGLEKMYTTGLTGLERLNNNNNNNKFNIQSLYRPSDNEKDF